jgi:hypothetical protein
MQGRSLASNPTKAGAFAERMPSEGGKKTMKSPKGVNFILLSKLLILIV